MADMGIAGTASIEKLPAVGGGTVAAATPAAEVNVQLEDEDKHYAENHCADKPNEGKSALDEKPEQRAAYHCPDDADEHVKQASARVIAGYLGAYDAYHYADTDKQKPLPPHFSQELVNINNWGFGTLYPVAGTVNIALLDTTPVFKYGEPQHQQYSQHYNANHKPSARVAFLPVKILVVCHD